VLKDIAALGRRVVNRRRLGRADDAVHQERYDGDHQNAGDSQGHHHLYHGETDWDYLPSDPTLIPGVFLVGRNHGTERTTLMDSDRFWPRNG
jgi:hypothetical protein